MSESFSLGVRAPGELAFFDVELPPLSEGAAVVRTIYSGVSAGTELGYLKGTDPAFTASFDRELGVFVPGTGSLCYPRTAMGYMEVAEVVDSRRPDLTAGDLVAAAYGHRSHHVIGPCDVAIAVPADVDPLLGVYLAQMGPICANGLLHAAAEYSSGSVSSLSEGVRDRTVLVTGGGVVGLLTAVFASHHGARAVAVADLDPQRLAAAAGLGVAVIDQRSVSPWQWCKEQWHHGPGDHGADLVFQCRGQAAVLHEALRSLRPQGAVIDLAYYQAGAAQLRLGEEFHHNGLTIRCAQINRVPRGMADTWDRRRLAAETGRLLADRGKDISEHVISDIIQVAEAPSVITALARRERSAIQIVLDFADGLDGRR